MRAMSSLIQPDFRFLSNRVDERAVHRRRPCGAGLERDAGERFSVRRLTLKTISKELCDAETDTSTSVSDWNHSAELGELHVGSETSFSLISLGSNRTRVAVCAPAVRSSTWRTGSLTTCRSTGRRSGSHGSGST